MKRNYLTGVLVMALVLLSACAAPQAEDVASADPSPTADIETNTYAGDVASGAEDDTVSGAEDESAVMEKILQQSREEFYRRAVGYKRLSEEEADVLYQRLLDSGVMERERMMVTGMTAGDYDGNGSTDMVVCLFSADEDADYYGDGCLYLFMNEDEPCRIYEEDCCYGLGYISDDFGADIDKDGKTEVVMLLGGLGNGGTGDFCKIVVKYQNPGIQKMELPGRTAYDYEIMVDVEGNPEKGVYIASCPEFDGEIEFSVGRQVDDMSGGNCRGFYSLKMGEYQGEEVLLGYEYLYAGGIVDYVGDAVFVIGWDEGGNPYVRDWYIERDMSSVG